jgi:outer membrane protein assembly factor BamD
MAFDHTGGRLMARPHVRSLARAAVALLLAAAAACASGPKKPPVGTLEPDKFLWERGTDSLNEKKWLTAREYFRQLVDSYPQSPYRADAKLGVGDTYLGEGTAEANVLAVNEFREFLSFYPTHRRAAYAQYKLGMAHYYEMHGPERDQTETLEAISELTTFVTRFAPPADDNGLMAEAKQHLREAKDRLSESMYRVGFFYFRSKWYPGAIDRFAEILRKDPEYTNRDSVYYYLAQSLLKVSRPAEALPYLERLVAEFEQSEYLAKAQKDIADIKVELEKKKGSE